MSKKKLRNDAQNANRNASNHRDVEGRKPNRLITEKSPYLSQHAHNPVDWWPWCEEAFETARREDKPIFLSIGYSTCHWCHVMEKESFEDPMVAELMNEAFVNIKVDREERPDIDHFYMLTALMVLGHGGWPLTVIMTPDKKPFFVATYIPKNGRFGNPGMLDIIPEISRLWKEDRGRLLEAADSVLQRVTLFSAVEVGSSLRESDLHEAFKSFARTFDERKGGFGHAPKFPSPHNYMFLLRYWKKTGNERALYMVEKTLIEMRMGGIFDHVGFGFHRYSTDREWVLPHFEKMLYDQALLTMAYVEAFQATKKQFYAKTAREILTYVLRELSSPVGGFYSAEDADSEGIEGKFYVWTLKELREILSKEEAEVVIKAFNVKKSGNFREESSGRRSGANILYLGEPIDKVAARLGMDPLEFVEIWEEARKKLFDVRKRRIHPNKDDKILTDWNGLMIAALAKAGMTLQDARYLKAAEKCANFLLTRMRDDQGRLLHRYKDGDAGILGFLDDYQFLIWGLLELYKATFKVDYLEAALELNEHALDHFWDKTNGGFYFTADYHGDDVIIRKKELFDGALPSGNSVAMMNLLQIGRITGNPSMETLSNVVGRVLSRFVRNAPSSFAHVLNALDFAVGPSNEIVIVGSRENPRTNQVIKALHSEFLPNAVMLFKPVDADRVMERLTKLAPFVKNMGMIDDQATIYVCRNHSCNLPTTSLDAVLEQLALKSE